MASDGGSGGGPEKWIVVALVAATLAMSVAVFIAGGGMGGQQLWADGNVATMEAANLAIPDLSAAGPQSAR